MKKNVIIAAAATLFLVACGEKEAESKTQEEVTHEQTEVCKYNLNEEGVEVNWTAFKFTERAGVGGTFDSVVVAGTSENEDIKAAVANTTFEIYTATVNSNNPDRDGKLANSFYGTMENGSVISGKINTVNEDGTGAVAITMNGIDKETSFNWIFEEDVFTLTTNINVEEWNATASVDTLNQICYDLHTGEDGVSKLWSDVDISVSAIFNKECK